jgi:hypothetical protein
VQRLDRFLAENYLPGFGSHVEYRGNCTIHSGEKDVSLRHLNRQFLTNVEWNDPGVGNTFYIITIADDSRRVAFTVKVSSEQAAQWVVGAVQELAASCGA